MLEKLRPLGKRALINIPGVYGLGKSAYQALKSNSERLQIGRKHPAAAFVNYSPVKLANLRSRGYSSQFGQDYYLWNHVLAHRPSGFYVEIGANHPALNSNSKFLESRGWKGVSFEPLGTFQEEWSRTRANPLLQVAISSSAGEEDFVEILAKEGWEHQLSAFASHVRQEDVDMYGSKKYKVPTAPLAEHLTPETHIDILMIDVEGAERSVLAGIDFGLIRPDHLLVENNAIVGGDPQLRSLIVNLGYNFVARLGLSDDLYRRRN